MTEHDQLAAVFSRDAGADGRFVYAVTTTGVYCRPSCPSRRPRQENIRLFADCAAAEQAGFRACKRCRPRDLRPADPALAAVRKAAEAIARHVEEGEEGPPRLADLAAAAGISPWHLQRIFSRELGLSPRQYADALRLGKLKQALKEGHGVAQAVYGAGFGSASRVYERAQTQLGMTPATYAKGGEGAEIRYAVRDCPLGKLLVAATPKGVCLVCLGDAQKPLEADLRAEFPNARLTSAGKELDRAIAACIEMISGRLPRGELALDVRATAFQWRVWQALQAIPAGETRSYREIAAAIGEPKAARAVGRACATNPVALVVPCHRAIREDGTLGGYRWGLERKEALLSAEQQNTAPKVSRSGTAR